MSRAERNMPVADGLEGREEIATGAGVQRIFRNYSTGELAQLAVVLARGRELLIRRGGMNGTAEAMADAVKVIGFAAEEAQERDTFRADVARRYYFGTSVALKAGELLHEAFDLLNAGRPDLFIEKARHALRVSDCLSGPENCDKAFRNE